MRVDQQSAQGNVADGHSKQDAISSAGEMAMKMVRRVWITFDA